MVTQVISVLAVRCVECGDAERLITVTPDAVISRCYVCGDLAVRDRSNQARTAGRGGRGYSGWASSGWASSGSAGSGSERSVQGASWAAPGPSR